MNTEETKSAPAQDEQIGEQLAANEAQYEGAATSEESDESDDDIELEDDLDLEDDEDESDED